MTQHAAADRPFPRLRSGAARRAPFFIVVTMLLCALTLAPGTRTSAMCRAVVRLVGPQRTRLRLAHLPDVCYSDIQYLWLGRDIDRHVFPYVNGGYDPVTERLSGGALEYPVLTGLAIYLAAGPSATDADFLFWSAVLLAMAGLLTAALLAWLAGLVPGGSRLLRHWCCTQFHNWDLFAVCASVVAFWALLRAGGTARTAGSARCGRWWWPRSPWASVGPSSCTR
jgi:hypothetical protein